MKGWNYHWVSEDIMSVSTEKAPTPIIHLYVRTMWEPTSDGMPKPRTEILGYITYNDAHKTWHIFLHKGQSQLHAKEENHLRAMVIIEDFFHLKLASS